MQAAPARHDRPSARWHEIRVCKAARSAPRQVRARGLGAVRCNCWRGACGAAAALRPGSAHARRRPRGSRVWTARPRDCCCRPAAPSCSAPRCAGTAWPGAADAWRLAGDRSTRRPSSSRWPSRRCWRACSPTSAGAVTCARRPARAAQRARLRRRRRDRAQPRRPHVTDEIGTQALGLTDLRLGLNVADGVWSFTQGLAGKTRRRGRRRVVARTSPQATWPARPTRRCRACWSCRSPTWAPGAPGCRRAGASAAALQRQRRHRRALRRTGVHRRSARHGRLACATSCRA